MWLPNHFLAIPISYVLVILLALLSRRMNDSARKWGMRGLVILMLCSELIKQIVVIVGGNYMPVYLPFHYSSTYYISLSMLVFGHGALKHFGACATYVGGFLLIGTMCANPFGVIGDTALLFASYYNFHSFFYHMFVLLLWAVMIANLDYFPLQWDELRYPIFLFVWAVCAVPASRTFHFNYAGLLKSFIPFLEVIRIKMGEGVYLIVYFVLTSLVGATLIALLRMICNRISQKKNAISVK